MRRTGSWISRLGMAMCAAMVLAFGAFAAGAEANRFLPAPGSPYAVGNEPYSVYSANFNGDPLPDLATLNGTSADINVFNQQPGDAGFAAHPGSPFAVGGGPSYGAVQDFNGDGRQDMAVAQYTGHSFTVMLQQSDGTFAPEGAATSIAGRASAIGAGDFNADNRPDLAVADWDSGSISIFLRKADNTGFNSPAVLGSGSVNPRYIAVGDLDGANGPDLAIAYSGSDRVSVLLNRPGGTFANPPGSPYTVGHEPQTVVIARLDGDGKPDIATANYGDDNVTVLDQQPNGSFAPQAGSPFAVGDAPVGIAAADFRGSGHVDLAVAESGANAFTILENDGTTFTRTPDVSISPATAAEGITAGQFNDGDSLPDLAVTGIGGSGAAGDPDRLSVFINQPPPRASTLDATDVTGGSATLHATVNPRGSDTDAHFEYGTTVGYGSLAPAGGELAAGADRGDHAISRAIDGLAPGTTYHFRVVTSNAGGSSFGEDRTFTTAATPPPPPSTLAGPPRAFLTAPNQVVAGSKTTLSAEGSTPAGGLTYKLDLDGSGNYATDLKTARSLQTTFTTPGDIKVGLQVTDSIGRTDTVRRTVHVTSPPVYAISIDPLRPARGDNVRFTIKQLVDDASKPGGGRLTDLPDGTLSTATYGDGSKLDGVAGALQIPGRDASTTGSFSHVFKRAGSFKVHVAVDDMNGFNQGVDLLVPVGRRPVYSPAITTASTTVDQGSCVSFENATFNQLPVDNKGPIVNTDINPIHKLIIVAPPKQWTPFGGNPEFDIQPVNITTLASSTVIAGSPFAHLAFSDIAAPALNFGRRALRRQAEPTATTSGKAACDQQANIEQTLANTKANFHTPPYPPGADAGWPAIRACGNDFPLVTYSTERLPITDPTTAQDQTTRHAFFSINRWDFGDGTKSGPKEYLPSYRVYHPYDKPGNYTVKLSTTYPADLAGQLATWNAACGSNPLDPTKDDAKRFDTRSTELKLHVRAHYDRIKSRGLWMTSGAKTFDETDLPGVYSSSGPIYVNTRRVGYGFDSATQMYHQDQDVSEADGVLIVTPDNGPLMVAADSGEIIGAAHLAWQSGGKTIALGPMPVNIKGTPGLVLPEAGAGGTHDLGVFVDPPAVLGSGAPPPVNPGDPPQGSPPRPGEPFHVNSAHVVLRERNGGPGGGSLEMNVHLPPPFGPNGGASDETIVQNVSGKGKLMAGSHDRRGLLDNVDVDIPAVELVPGIVSFDGGKLSHHVNAVPPWQATGGLTVFGKKVSMSPDSKKDGCPVSGGLGFQENGSLYNAGAVLDGLEIPLPNPPAPNPIAALANPAFEILPATKDRPLDLFGCLSLRDYPSHDTFTVTGCIGFLSAGSGVAIPNNEVIPFCPDERRSQRFALTDQNSTTQGAPPGHRIMRGIVVRGSGEVGLGPKAFPVGDAYLEYRLSDGQSTIEAKGHVGADIIKGHLSVSGDIFGRFRSLTDWDIGGEGGVKQDIICVPGTKICLAPRAALLIAYKGFGVCAQAYGGIGVGGSITFSDLALHPHVPGCELSDLRKDLGVPGRVLPRYGDLLLRPEDPILAFGAANSTGVQMKAGSPYSVIVVNGTDSSPVVQVRDPSGKLVIDDNGQPVQGLKASPGSPAAVDIASQTPPAARPLAPQSQQGLIHNDLSTYHDANVDLRHTTMIQIRTPKSGRYTITTKGGSSPITAISHADALPTPRVHAGVIKRKGRKRMLMLQSKLPAGSSMTIAEEGRTLSHRIASVSATGSRAAAAGAQAARVNKHVAFKPALGDGGKRKLIAVISRDGIPQERMTIGSYRAPAPPKAGRIRGLHVKRRGSKLTVTWRRAANATRYVVTLKLRKGATTTKSVGPKGHRLVLREALARKGATVTVRAIGPLSVAGKPASHRLRAEKVKRRRHFVL